MEMFEKICKELCNLYEKKNHDYGNSFGRTFEELGIISAITRISDKFHRLVNLTTKVDAKVDDESLEDTLKDLASYSIMTLAEIRKAKGND